MSGDAHDRGIDRYESVFKFGLKVPQCPREAILLKNSIDCRCLQLAHKFALRAAVIQTAKKKVQVATPPQGQEGGSLLFSGERRFDVAEIFLLRRPFYCLLNTKRMDHEKFV